MAKITKKQKRNRILLAAAAAAGGGLFFYTQYIKAQNITLSPLGINSFNISLIQNKISFVFKVGLNNTTDLKINLKSLEGQIKYKGTAVGSFNIPAEVLLLKNSQTALNVLINIPITQLITSVAELVANYTSNAPLGITINYTAKTSAGKISDLYEF
jgi:hypothetical protein